MTKTNYKIRVENSPYSQEAREMGLRLRALREEKKLSMYDFLAQFECVQRDDEKQVTLSQSQYARIESGTAFVNTEIVYALCDFHRVSPDYLLRGIESVEYDLNCLINSTSSENLQSSCDFLENLANGLRKIAKDK